MTKTVRSSEKKFFLFQDFCPAVGWDKISTDISIHHVGSQRVMSEDSGGAVMGRGGSDSDSVFSEERCVQVQIHSVSTSH